MQPKSKVFFCQAKLLLTNREAIEKEHILVTDLLNKITMKSTS